MNTILAFDFTNFVGRFHPLFVHLPIGFLILGVLMEWYQRIRKSEKLSNLIAYAWLLGGIGGAFAAFCGWYLGETGLYFEDDLFLHRWIGIAIVVLSFAGWWLKKNSEKHSTTIHQIANIGLIALISLEGHLGGNLTHGEEYLFEYAPESVKNMMLDEKDATTDLSRADSVVVYTDLVQPIFEQKCMACHDNNVQRGGLNMASIDSMLVGGDGGPAFASGDISESEIFERITLPQKNIKFMPPVGDPLTYDEIKIVEWWISQGASAEATIADIEIPDGLKPTLLRTYNLDTNPKAYYETVSIPPLDSIQITNLEKNGFKVNILGGQNPLLDLKFIGSELTDKQIQSLEPAAKHITWLSFAKTNISDKQLTVVSKFENLTRLQLERTAISDEGVSTLSSLKHLEALNLYGTQVSKACIPSLQSMRSLQRVYLWNTKIQKIDVQELQEKIDVVIGEG